MNGTSRAPDSDVAHSVNRVHTLVLGSGAAGLNAAVQLRNHGVEDVLIVTEGLEMGTSINTGSDKQTYYKLSLCGADADAPRLLAETFFAGNSMHGDLALVEAANSARAFLNLVNLGVPFPRDPYGQFVGYKTDHDPRQRATSIGPYTSREMCRALIREVRRREIPVREGRVAVELLTIEQNGARRAAGILALDPEGRFETYLADNVVFAVGGPGGLYRTSVYPPVHTGAIGLALMAGARAQSLPESQYGMASTKFRWNVSGTYMQVIPAFVSTDADGRSNPREFLRDVYSDAGLQNSMVFLKGYQWPFDPRKIEGSSLIDILVYIETVQKGRRVFLDFRRNPEGFSMAGLSDEARTYLEKSRALQETPFLRLKQMNPGAIELYRDHGIDLEREPLEIAVCAQHNNGGLAGDAWWRSANLARLFPVGEVNGSHGVYRPGGSALNSGQVGSLRAAEYIAARCAAPDLDAVRAAAAARSRARDLADWLRRCAAAKTPWRADRDAFQTRMSRAAAHIRSREELDRAVAEARQQWERLQTEGCAFGPGEAAEALRNRQLCFAHWVYLDAVRFQVESGVGSRGSAMVMDPKGRQAHPKLGERWRYAPENEEFRNRVLETTFQGDGTLRHVWVPRRPIPEGDHWFETAWAAFREGRIYDI